MPAEYDQSFGAGGAYDNGIAAGAPPTFEPIPVQGESFAPDAFDKYKLPRFGGGGGIAVDAPKGDGGAQEVPTATKVAPSPLVASGMPILRAAPEAELSPGSRAGLAGALVLVVLSILFLFTDRDE